MCQKLKYGDQKSPSILLGLIVSDDENFITFKTSRKQYTINKIQILEIEDTNEVFIDHSDDGWEK